MNQKKQSILKRVELCVYGICSALFAAAFFFGVLYPEYGLPAEAYRICAETQGSVVQENVPQKSVMQENVPQESTPQDSAAQESTPQDGATHQHLDSAQENAEQENAPQESAAEKDKVRQRFDAVAEMPMRETETKKIHFTSYFYKCLKNS